MVIYNYNPFVYCNSKYIEDYNNWPELEKWYLLGLKMFLEYHVKVKTCQFQF